MARAKVRLADNIARVVFIETDATRGATLGENVFTPDGVAATPATFRTWLGVSTGGQVAAQNHSQLAGLTYGNDHPQYVLRSILTAQGDLFIRGASVIERLGIGTNQRVLGSNGTDPLWRDTVHQVVGTATRIAVDSADPFAPVVTLAAEAIASLLLADSAVQPARQIISGAGLTGGGDLSANRTFNVGAGTGITVNADDVALSAATIASLALADSALQSGDNVSLLVNDAGYITSASLPVGANPTASVGLAAVNGVAATFLRSDGAPALSQAIAPTWTATHLWSPTAGIPITIQPVLGSAAISANNATGDIYFRQTTLGVRDWAFGAQRSPDQWVVSGTSDLSNPILILTGDGRARFGIGSAASPSLSFISDTDTGICTLTSNALSIVAGGVEIARFDNTPRILITDGSAADPALAFLGDANTGIYLPVANDLWMSLGGTGYPIGYRGLPWRSILGAGAPAQTDDGRTIYAQGTGPYAVTLGALAENTAIVILVTASGGITVASGSGTLTWLSGSAIATGTRTLSIGAVVTVQRVSSSWVIWGSGIT